MKSFHALPDQKCIFDNFFRITHMITQRIFFFVLPYFSLVLLLIHWSWSEDRQVCSQLCNVTNEYHSNTENLTATTYEWGRNCFEIYRSAFEYIAIPSCTRHLPWMSKDFKNKWFQYDLTYLANGNK